MTVKSSAGADRQSHFHRRPQTANAALHHFAYHYNRGPTFDGRRWRAGLPEEARIASAIAELVSRTGISEDKALALTRALTSRGMLEDVTPTELTTRWSHVLGLEEQEMALFLIEADYVL